MSRPDLAERKRLAHDLLGAMQMIESMNLLGDDQRKRADVQRALERTRRYLVCPALPDLSGMVLD